VKEKAEIFWAYEHIGPDQNYADYAYTPTKYRTGCYQDSFWPNQSCKEDDLELFYFKPVLIHYMEAVGQSLPFVFPISLRHFIGGDVTNLEKYDKQLMAFDWVPNEVLDACRRNQCVLYFEDRFEGYPEINGSQTKFFSDLAMRLEIPTHRIVVSTGNALLPSISEKYNTGITFVHEDWFRTEFTYRKIKQNLRIDHDVDKKKKLYLCYNRHWNSNRQNFVYELWKNNLLNRGLISLPAATYEQHVRINQYDYWKPWVQKITDVTEILDNVSAFLSELPLILDSPTFENMADKSNTSHYLDSYISVVTETWGNNNTVFVTEKTYKAIMAEHPFMILSSQYFLRHLKNVGFKTYGDWLDESYDNEPIEGNRARMIVKELDRLSRMSTEQFRNFWQGTREIALFNRQVLEADYDYAKNLFTPLKNKYIYNGVLE